MDVFTLHRDAFHAHLDVCSRCANRPFDLCETGGRLLEVAAKTAFATPHEKECEDRLICAGCMQQFKTKDAWSLHVRTHHQAP